MHSVERLLEQVPFQGSGQFAMDRFVLAMNGLTTWGILKQSLREVDVRARAISEEEARLSRERGLFRTLLRKILGKPSNLSERRVLRLRAERDHFARRALETAGDLGISPEDEIEQRTLDALDAQEYAVRFARLALIEKAANGSISSGTLESILALPQAQAQGIVGMVYSITPGAAMTAAIDPGLPQRLDEAVDNQTRRSGMVREA